MKNSCMLAIFFAFALLMSCKKTDPIPGVTNSISYNYNGTAYSSPATFTTSSSTISGVALTEVFITSANLPVLSLTFGFSNSTLTGYVGLASSPTSTYDLAKTPNLGKINSTSATSGSLSISSYDGNSLSGTFSFVGANFTVTGGQLSSVTKL